MPCHGGSRPAHDKFKSIIEHACGLAKAEDVHPAGREFDRQRNSIEPPANSGGNRRIRIGQLEMPLRTACTRSTNS